MNDLSGLVNEAVKNTMTPERVNEAVQKHVDDLIKQSLKDSLSFYSPLGKQIKEAVEESLKVNQLDLPSYGSTVASILKTQIDAQVAELVAGRLKQDMEDLLSLAPKTIKLSKIVEDMLEQNPDNHEVYCLVERTEYGSTWIYLHDSPVSRKYEASISILLSSDGTISSGKIDEKDLKATKTIGRFYGTGQLIRAYYACGTLIEVDADYVVTERQYD